MVISSVPFRVFGLFSAVREVVDVSLSRPFVLTKHVLFSRSGRPARDFPLLIYFAKLKEVGSYCGLRLSLGLIPLSFFSVCFFLSITRSFS